MKQQEFKDLTLAAIDLADQQYNLDTQRNCLLVAQVYATLATIPDPIESESDYDEYEC